MEPTTQPIMECKNCGRLYFSTEDFLAHTSRWRICEESHLWFNCACESTNVIKKGRHDWYDPMHRLSQQAQSIFNQIPALRALPRLPTSVMELLQKIDDANADFHELAALARHDPLLAAKIIRIAENQTIHHQTKPKSLSHAISLVGRHHVKEIVLLAAINCVEPKTRFFHTNEFWDHSMTIGRIAEHLSKKFKTGMIEDEAYITGCLCNLGKLVLALVRPDIADRFQVEINDIHTLGPWTAAEQRHAAYQHTVIGEIGGALWGLSEASINAIQGHHSVSHAAQVAPYELVALANQFAHWIWLQPHQMDKVLFQQLQQRFHLSQRDSELLADEMMPLAIQERAS